MKARLLVPLLALALACAGARTIPGTDVPDTPEARAVSKLLESYREAMERRDAQGVLALVAPDYLDGSGTPDPRDDVDRAGLEKRLGELAQVDGLRMKLALRRLEVKGDTARAEVFFDQFYRVQTPNGLVPRHDTDVHEMALKRVGGGWQFLSGL